MGRSSREDGGKPLHHTREVRNMRSEYDHGPVQKSRERSEGTSPASTTSSEKSYPAHSSRSTASDKSNQTLATNYSADYFMPDLPAKRANSAAQKVTSTREHRDSRLRENASPQKRPLVHQPHSEQHRYEHAPQYHYFEDKAPQESPRSSIQSITSTLADEDFDEPPPELDVLDSSERVAEASNVIAATPSDFSQLFPSSRTLLIHHDDTTDDGNMNLRLDTEVSIDGQIWDMTLFHLRLQDLRNREFSLRRYCRDSGREVCHTTRKQQKSTTDKRPGFSRSLSNALTSMRTSSGHKIPTLSRNDSGYSSVKSSSSLDEHLWAASPADRHSKPQEPQLSDMIRLEFSNYAQAGIKRVGSKGNKRYEFEYWNIHYSWRRVVQRHNDIKKVSYYLTKNGSEVKLAHITPVDLNVSEAELEHDKGGWIPPCRMRIMDKNILKAQKDLSDVIVACGLVAIVDDAIRSRLESNEEKSGVQYVGPKRLINEMFNRKESESRVNTRPPSSRQSSRPSTSGSGYTASGVTSRST